LLWTEGVVQLGKLLFSSKARMTLSKPWAEIGKKLGTGGFLIHHIFYNQTAEIKTLSGNRLQSC